MHGDVFARCNSQLFNVIEALSTADAPRVREVFVQCAPSLNEVVKPASHPINITSR